MQRSRLAADAAPLLPWPAFDSQTANGEVSMKPNADVIIGSGPRAVTFGNRRPLAIIAGPCALESRDHALKMAGSLREIADRLGVGIVYKSSFDKANRTSAAGRRGLGLEASLAIFAEVKERFGFPILTDVHENDHCAKVAGVVDVLQIPAFLCRQTDLLLAAAATGLPVIRCGNAGWSGSIDALGRAFPVTNKGTIYFQGSQLISPVAIAKGPHEMTFWVRYGDWAVGLGGVCFGLTYGWRRRRGPSVAV
jgi:hypothetical protein